MNKILFPTAYSKSSNHTWQYALQLANHFDAEITMLHVVNSEADKKLDKSYELERLRDFAIEHSPSAYEDVFTNFIVREGQAAEVILQEEINDYDLIIMGTSTVNQFPEKIFGSVALAVADKSITSVLLVPPMLKYRGVQNITFATNQQLINVDTLDNLTNWMKAFNSDYQLLHISKKALVNKEMEALVESYQEEHKDSSFSYQLLEGDFITEIEDQLNLDSSDILALTFANKGFFNLFFKQTIIRKITADSMMPVLVIKES